jgi:hypothetical protein
MQLRKAVKNKMFPHLLAAFQWIFLVTSLAFNLNYSVAVTGAVANNGLKAIMLFHVWMLFFPVVLCLLFYRIRDDGIADKCAFGLSIITILFSLVNVFLYFVNELVILMKAAEVVAWSLYNCVFSVSMYKISIVFLLPIIRRAVRTQKEKLQDDKKLRVWG